MIEVPPASDAELLHWLLTTLRERFRTAILAHGGDAQTHIQDSASEREFRFEWRHNGQLYPLIGTYAGDRKVDIEASPGGTISYAADELDDAKVRDIVGTWVGLIQQ